MKQHSRFASVQIACSEFDLFWARSLKRLGISTYEDGYLVLNQIDRFWIDACRQDLSMGDACGAWDVLDCSKFALSSAVREVGDELARKVEQYGLTYGEIFSALARIRSSDAKYHIRVERHPDDPDHPGDLE